MEFWGFIYTKEEVFKDFFHPNGYKITNDYSINSNEIKKYYNDGKWIFSTSNRYLKTLNLRKYIIRSKTFAKIQFSSKQNILKFDYLEKGKFKKQLIIQNGLVKKNKGFYEYASSSKTTTQIFFDLVKDNFGLDEDFVETKAEYFINERKQDYELRFWDYIAIRYALKGMVVVLFSPILAYYLLLTLLEAYQNDNLQPIPIEIYIIFLLFFSITFFLFRYAYSEIKNYLLIKNKVLDDGIITLPNNTYK